MTSLHIVSIPLTEISAGTRSSVQVYCILVNIFLNDKLYIQTSARHFHSLTGFGSVSKVLWSLKLLRWKRSSVLNWTLRLYFAFQSGFYFYLIYSFLIESWIILETSIYDFTRHMCVFCLRIGTSYRIAVHQCIHYTVHRQSWSQSKFTWYTYWMWAFFLENVKKITQKTKPVFRVVDFFSQKYSIRHRRFCLYFIHTY